MGLEGPAVRRFLKCLVITVAISSAFPQVGAWPITRDEVMDQARSFVSLDWQCGRRNASRQYNLLEPGKSYQGVSYNWGGFDSPSLFLNKVESGKVAGNYKKRCGERLCVRFDFAGLDCSGLVSRCWQVRHFSTKALQVISIKIQRKMLKPGDILNSHNKHVVLFDRFDDEGGMWAFESSSWVRQQGAPPAGVVYRSVDLGDDYVPRRFYKFINPGDRVRTERAVVAREKFKGGKRWVIPAKTAGTISNGPGFKDKSPVDATPSDVWYFIEYDNGKRGWSTLRDLILIEEAEQLPATDPSVS
jgi:hypothetical protein